MAASIVERLAPRPVATLMDELADALGWPRSRPVRVLAGERSQLARRVVICAAEAGIAQTDQEPDTVVLLAAPAAATTGGGRSGKRGDDPFFGDPGSLTGWRRAERAVLDAALPLAGGRGGIDERIAARAGLDPTTLSPLRSVTMDTVKLVGFVPTDALESVRTAIFDAGAGSIGDYDMCSFSVAGTGTFRGGEGTDPVVGTRGEFEQVEEQRVEVVLPTRLVDRACRAFVATHPYEQPAFDVVPLATPAGVGFGRIGRLTGDGRTAWSALEGLDQQLSAYGPVADAPAGSMAGVHAGALSEVLGPVLGEDDLKLVVVGSATELELELLVERGIGVLVLDRRRGVEAVGSELAGMLSRVTGLPVHFDEGLKFPGSDDADAGAGAEGAASSASTPTPAAGASGDGWGRASATDTYRMQFDGGSRGNPGPAAYGWAIYSAVGDEFDAEGVTVGRATNNVAEWTGLLRGLERALEHGIRRLDVRGDSELVIKQVTGVYRVKNADLKPIADAVKSLLPQFEKITFQHVYRTDNARADELANEALDGLR